MEKENYFLRLNAIDVNARVEHKNGLSYLSWAWAWGEIKKRYPDTVYTVYEDSEGRFYHTDGKTCWVKTGITCNGIEHVEYLPVMDNRNKSIPLASVTSVDVNKAVQRSLTKAVARHGLGLYIYAGEDLPEPEDGVKRLGPNGSNAIYKRLAGKHNAARVKQAMQEACTSFQCENPPDIPQADEKKYITEVEKLLTGGNRESDI